jgi:hypothetical protein
MMVLILAKTPALSNANYYCAKKNKKGTTRLLAWRDVVMFQING